MSDSSPNDAPVVEVEIPRFTKYDEGLQDSFAKDVSNQVDRMDDLAKQLISLNLAIPALYGAVLKLTQGETATTSGVLILIAFAAWLLSLGLALVTLIPLKNKVNPDSTADIEQYFAVNTQRKQKLVIASSMITFFGICLVIFGMVI